MPTDRIDISTEEDDSDDEAGNLLPGYGSLEPGQPTLENILFVLLGVILALAVVGRLVLLYG